MKKTVTLKIEKPVILTVIKTDTKSDEKVYMTCVYSYETSEDSKELENRISHTISLEIMLSCSMKYATGIRIEDILQSNIDIKEDMMNRLKWSFDDECKILDFKVVDVHFEKQKEESSIKWLCICGSVNDSNFCPVCGKEKSLERWICTCGRVNVGNYCTQCGNKKAM